MIVNAANSVFQLATFSPIDIGAGSLKDRIMSLYYDGEIVSSEMIRRDMKEFIRYGHESGVLARSWYVEKAMGELVAEGCASPIADGWKIKKPHFWGCAFRRGFYLTFCSLIQNP